MFKFKALTYLILFTATPPLIAYPQEDLSPHIIVQVVDCESDQSEESHLLSYDEIINLLDELESGELEEKCSTADLERINQFLALLAKEGTFSNSSDDDLILESDIEELLEEENSPFDYALLLGSNDQYMVIPAIFSGYAHNDVILCKGWVKKKWEKTKKFVKKHKTVIIIGAVVVVAATVVVAAVAASSAGAAAAAAGGAAGAAAPSGSKRCPNIDSKKLAPHEELPSLSSASSDSSASIAAVDEAPLLKATIDEHVLSFKGFIAEDIVAQQVSPSQREGDLSFGEKARELGAHLAHKAYDEVVELARVVPQLFEEINQIGSRLLPECPVGSPIENYESLVAKGHKAIDSVFSTDQSDCFAAIKAGGQMNNVAIALIPPPGAIFKNFADTSNFVKAGQILDQG